MTKNISFGDFGSLHAASGGIGSSDFASKPYYFKLSGYSSAFPLDHYYADLIINIPFKDVTIPPPILKFGESYNSTWRPLSPSNDKNLAFADIQKQYGNYCDIQNNMGNFICDDPTGTNTISKNTFVKIHMDFTSNDFPLWAITFPILFIFFLLGTICFLEPEDHYLVARIAITLGVFAFVFTFDTMLPNVKPHSILTMSTFADFLLKLVLIAAIASTISSVIGYRIRMMKSNYNKGWINRIQSYHLYDGLTVVSVLGFIILECLLKNQYHIDERDLIVYPITILIGLGWGLLAHIMYKYRSRKKNILLYDF